MHLCGMPVDVAVDAMWAACGCHVGGLSLLAFYIMPEGLADLDLAKSECYQIATFL